MPQLRDPRREKFAFLIFKGTSVHRAAIEAGYSKQTAVASCRMRDRADVAQRIAELNAQAAYTEARALERARVTHDVSTERVIGEYAKCAFANMLDYVRLDKHGHPRFDFASITRDQGSAISEMIIDEYKDGRGRDAPIVKRVRVKLVPKSDALQALGRHLGLFVDPSVLNVNVSNFFSEQPPSMAEWRKEIESTAVEIPKQLKRDRPA